MSELRLTDFDGDEISLEVDPDGISLYIEQPNRSAGGFISFDQAEALRDWLSEALANKGQGKGVAESAVRPEAIGV
ncbi:MAG: hypothetical protein HRU12_03985 [Phaeodactylibacter sp.]|nr:hypothetical protein [Phaeodactylibacter sp.]